MRELLLGRAEFHDHRGAGGEGRHGEARGIFVPGQFLVEGAVVIGGQALPAQFPREAETGKAAVVELALERAVTRHGDEFLFVVSAVLRQVEGLERAEIGLDPFARAQAEGLDAFDLLAHAAASLAIWIRASRRRCSAGVP